MRTKLIKNMKRDLENIPSWMPSTWVPYEWSFEIGQTVKPIKANDNGCKSWPHQYGKHRKTKRIWGDVGTIKSATYNDRGTCYVVLFDYGRDRDGLRKLRMNIYDHEELELVKGTSSYH